MIDATIAPTWMIAVYAVTLGSSIGRPIIFSTTVRCPVDEMGRNSVMPSTMPSTIDCHQLIMGFLPGELPRDSLTAERGRSPRPPRGVFTGRVARLRTAGSSVGGPL